MVVQWPQAREAAPVSPADTILIDPSEPVAALEDLESFKELDISSKKLVGLLAYEHEDPPVGPMDPGAELRFGPAPHLTPDVSDYSYDRSGLKRLLESHGMHASSFLSTSDDSFGPVPEYGHKTGGLESTDPLHQLREAARRKAKQAKAQSGDIQNPVSSPWGVVDDAETDSLPGGSDLSTDQGQDLPWIDPKSVVMGAMTRLDQRRWSKLFVSLYGLPVEMNDPTVRNRRMQIDPQKRDLRSPEMGS